MPGRWGSVARRVASGIGPRRAMLWAIIVLALLYVAASAALSSGDIARDDEFITMGVSERIWAEHSLDTNWINVPAVARAFPGDQFNFSGAILAAQLPAALIGTITGEHGVAAPFGVHAVRLTSALFTGLAFVLLFLAFRRFMGDGKALLGTIGAMLCAQLLQDSTYARPEAFVLLAYAAGLWLSAGLLIALAGVCGGLLVATKFSGVAALAQFLAFAVGWELWWREPGRPRSRRTLAAAGWGLLVLAGAVVGFAIGAPYAVLNPQGFIGGVGSLLTQYSHPFPPYGRAEAGLAERVWYGLQNLGSEVGLPALMFAGAGAILWARRRPLLALLVLAVPVCFIGYFLQNGVFFARNYNLFVPVLFYAAAYGSLELLRMLLTPFGDRLKSWVTRTTVVALLLAPPAALSLIFAFGIIPSEAQRLDVQTARARAAMIAYSASSTSASTTVLTRQAADRLAEKSAKQPLLLRIRTFNDPYSEAGIERLVRDHGYVVVGSVAPQFRWLPQSTLTGYHDPGMVLLAPPGLARLPLVALSGRGTSYCELPGLRKSGKGFEEKAVARTARPPKSVKTYWGTWGHTSDLRRIRIGPVPAGQWVLPVVTGRSGQGGLLRLLDADGKVLYEIKDRTFLTWQGLTLPRIDVPFTVEAVDRAKPAGQWMGVGLPLQPCPAK